MAVFNSGDVVQLKSGGEPMTVEEWDETKQRYCCVWREKSKIVRNYFTEATLDKYEQPEIGVFHVG